MPNHCMQRLRSEWPVVALAAGFVLLVCMAQILSDRYGGWVFMRLTYSAGAWWQLGTSQWVHFGGFHAALNAAGLLLMLWALQGLVAGRLQCAALVGGYIGVATVLALDPACAYYAGASGALHGFWAGNAVALLGCPPPTPQRSHRLRWVGGVMLLAMVLKLWLQQRGVAYPYPWHALEPMPGFWGWTDFPVYGLAHVAGAAGGMGAVGLYALGRFLRTRALAQRSAGTQQ